MDSNETVLALKGQKKTKSVDVSSNVKLAFVPDWGQLDERIVVMVSMNNDYRILRMSEECDIEEDVTKEFTNEANPKALKQLDNSLDLQAVVGQYSHKDYINKTGYEGHGMVLFFVDGNAVKYCFSGPKVLSEKVICF